MTEYKPDWVSVPGETIADIIEERGISPEAFGEMLGRDLPWVLGLLKGDVLIDVTLAHELAEVFGITAQFWLNREKNYRSRL